MNFKKNGINFSDILKDKNKLIKLALSLILSNLFFYILFSRPKEEVITTPLTDEVQIQIRGNLRTPFQKRKSVLLIDRIRGQKIQAVLEEISETEPSLVTVSVKEEFADETLNKEQWEIVPLLKSLGLRKIHREDHHEIYY